MNKEQLTSILESKENDYYRGCLDKSNGNYIYDPQINAAKEIVLHLGGNTLRTNHVVLVAPMQSGKTSTCISVVNIINKAKLNANMHIKRVLFISGMNDCGLKEQTSQRVINQIIDIDKDEVVIGREKQISYKSKYFILKNSDLLHYKHSLDNTLIFIDESHYGANETNNLTKFFAQNDVNWKNTMDLLKRNIYIVSISATPFSELVSDTVEVKKIVELKPDNDYLGISDFLDKDVVFDAAKDDIEQDGAIFDYIMDAKFRMDDNQEAGAIFIRTRNFNIIKTNDYVKKYFDVFEMDSNGSKIQYDELSSRLNNLVDCNLHGTSVCKPLIVLIKGAFRAGITINSKHKPYIYMVHDFSVKADTTAQAMLGRMCGYRSDAESASKTYFYINKKFADMYSEWSKDFTNRNLIPSSSIAWDWVDSSYEGDDVKFGSKPCGNFAFNISDTDIAALHEFKKHQTKDREKLNKFITNLLIKYGHNIKYDYIGEVHIGGKNNYAKSSQVKRFDSFSDDSLVFQFRPEKIKQFTQDTNRTYLDKTDLGKKCISIVLDTNIYGEGDKIQITGNRRILVYYVEVGQKCRTLVRKKQYQKHKDTNLNVK